MSPLMERILVAMLEAQEEDGLGYFPMTGNEIGHACGFRTGSDRHARDGRMMGAANRVAFPLTALRKLKLVGFAKRRDDRSGSADVLTREGREMARALRERGVQPREEKKMGDASEASNQRKLIEARCQREGLTIRGWETTEDGETAKLGRYVVVTGSFEDHGLYQDDVGELSACVVGSVEFGNQRVHFSLTADGYDEGNEVQELSAVEAVA